MILSVTSTSNGGVQVVVMEYPYDWDASNWLFEYTLFNGEPSISNLTSNGSNNTINISAADVSKYDNIYVQGTYKKGTLSEIGESTTASIKVNTDLDPEIPPSEYNYTTYCFLLPSDNCYEIKVYEGSSIALYEYYDSIFVTQNIGTDKFQVYAYKDEHGNTYYPEDTISYHQDKEYIWLSAIYYYTCGITK